MQRSETNDGHRTGHWLKSNQLINNRPQKLASKSTVVTTFSGFLAVFKISETDGNFYRLREYL